VRAGHDGPDVPDRNVVVPVKQDSDGNSSVDGLQQRINKGLYIMDGMEKQYPGQEFAIFSEIREELQSGDICLAEAKGCLARLSILAKYKGEVANTYQLIITQWDTSARVSDSFHTVGLKAHQWATLQKEIVLVADANRVVQKATQDPD